MQPASARRCWLALLLVGAALSTSPAGLPATPVAPPPDGFVWEKLPAIRAAVLRPEGWFFRCVVPASPFYECSPQPFAGPTECLPGVIIHVMQRTTEPADGMAAARIAQWASTNPVLRGWTKKGLPSEPFTTYGVVVTLQNEETDGVKCTCEVVFVANRVTNTLYQCSLCAPVAAWKEVEPLGETMLANLRLDPKF